MRQTLIWLYCNKEWLFSGLGITAIALIGRIFVGKKPKFNSQSIKSGKNSNNVVAGGNVYFGRRENKNDLE